ncbi:MAG: hypothetical protein OEV95_04895 [Gemmatimonadota bacterium]|nr:hypothetical protein [Gemmatimonadota bacterium]MDH5283546.1 hypothetical protein [Gemmatimonadota bacterium]
MCSATDDRRRRVRRGPASAPGLLLPLAALVQLSLASPAGLAAQTVTVRGWLTAIFTEQEPPASPLRFLLNDDRGGRFEVLLDESVARGIGSAALHRGFRAEVELEARPARLRAFPGQATPSHRAIRVTRLSPPAAVAPGLAVTAYPYVTILCRFADIGSEPFQPAQVNSRMGGSYPGADHFFGELSEGQASLAGSITLGWYVLPKPRSGYVSGTTLDFGAITADCTAAADADVYFPQYHGVILQFNAGLSVRSTAPFDTLSFGGSSALLLDGAARAYPMVWMSREHVFNYVVLHHELGHSLGWPHSSGPYSQTYDSRWDIMSRGYIYQDPVYGYLGPHTVAYHKDLTGWLPPARVWRSGSGGPASFLLLRSALPPAGPGYQAAVLPITGTAKFLTVETRLIGGYDRGLPAEGVLIHEVDPARWDRTAQVVDPDGNGDPNDAAAVWVPGERFVDPASGYVIQVDSAAPEGFWVTMSDRSHALAASVRVDSALVGDTAIKPDSVGLMVFGTDSLTASWTVAHSPGAHWVRLVTTAGQGSGLIRWERDPGGLPVGVYVDTLTVILPGSATGTPHLVDSFHVLPPLSLAVTPASRHDSVPQGQAAPASVSALVTFAGYGGDVAPWSASHGAASWITVVTPDGNGGGPLTWSRDASGLPPGLYVDTLRVTAPGASGSPAELIDSLVVYQPVIAVACATSVLLSGGGCLGAVGESYLDQTGNQDGSYDLGDLLAYLDRKGLPLPSSMDLRGLATGGVARRPGGAPRAHP